LRWGEDQLDPSAVARILDCESGRFTISWHTDEADTESIENVVDMRLILVYSMPEAKRPMTNSTARDLFPGALEMMILESLRRQPAHGYALVQHIQQRSNNLLQVEEGSLYPALQRLLKAKLVKAEWGVSSTNRRVRTYEITASGIRHLEKEISSFERMFEGIALVLNPGSS
jgi:PadR family transcriptional regulator, regulatory protein PadR